MEDMKRISLPLSDDDADMLRAGDMVMLSGTIYTGRDAAHKRLHDLIEKGESLPISLERATIYYVGPTPAKPPYKVGPAGPTSSYRMDPYTPELLDRGLKAMIGKGRRSREVVDSMIKNHAVYFGAIGGTAAVVSKGIISSRILAYEDLGTEAIHEYQIQDFPAIVIIDSLGNNLYETGPAKYQKEYSGRTVSAV